MAITQIDYETGELKTSYVGRVISVYHRDYRAMSDVYTYATFALVLADSGNLEEVMVNANFECDTRQGSATVDAEDWVLRAKSEHDAKVLEAQNLREELARQARAREEMNRPVKGKKMKVVKGRKAPVGTVGVVAYVHSDGRVLLKNESEWQDRKANGVWVAAGNLEAA